MNVSREEQSPRPSRRALVVGVTVPLLAGAGLLVMLGCGSARESAVRPVATAPIPAEASLDAEGHPEGIHRYRKWSDKIGQGGQPEGEVAFRNLAALGYTTIVSVDGARPDVENASKYGLRYVHVPVGYDGVPKDAQERIVKACETSEGPVFVHCHHGRHRGPAAAMIARIAFDGISNAQAVADLEESGCAADYKGLYRDVLAAVPPTKAALAQVPANLPSYVSPGDIAAQMASVDVTWDRVGKVKDAGWVTTASMPDVDPPHEVRILWEKLREMGRLDETRAKGGEFSALLTKSEEAGRALEDSIRKGDKEAATKAWGAVKQSCTACHDRWRNN